MSVAFGRCTREWLVAPTRGAGWVPPVPSVEEGDGGVLRLADACIFLAGKLYNGAPVGGAFSVVQLL